ncbi:MAG: hypothetical protein A2Z14_16910 [Chloroflexi bacterium RBG_16_48_8]|nr:MAG: hypothetical protein A2Z14_16910 [Chloroflexi bacterium RBG_16_48_8]
MGEIQPEYVKEEYPHLAITSQIIAAAKEVHRVLGPGYQEVIYQHTLVLELPVYGLRYVDESPYSAFHKCTRKPYADDPLTSLALMQMSLADRFYIVNLFADWLRLHTLDARRYDSEIQGRGTAYDC